MNGPRLYTLTVIVRDDAAVSLSATAVFNIYVTHVNNAPTCVANPPPMFVPENSLPGTIIGMLSSSYIYDK